MQIDSRPRVGSARRGTEISAPLLLLLAFASSGLAQQQVLVEVGDTWKYFKGTVAPPADWNSLAFDDSAVEWIPGATGIGYADGDDATVLADMEMTATQPGYMAFFARRAFTVPTLASIATLTLQIDYDDGFVAYLNGVEIARRGLGNPGDPVAFNAAATSREIGPDEYISIPLADLREGNNLLAIQLHNAALNSTDASLVPRLLANAVAPPTALLCTVPAAGTVNLAWTNNGTYDSLRVERNGSVLATLGGGETTYTDVAPSTLDNRYLIIAESEGTDLPSNVCTIACTQIALNCTLVLVGGVTQASLSWASIPQTTQIQVLREGAARAALDATATSYTDQNVEDQMAEDDTDYQVIITTTDGSTCTLACQASLCPRVSASTGAGQITLTFTNVVKAWDHFEISRNGQVVDSNVSPTITAWVDPNVVLEVGSSYDYVVHPVALGIGALPDPGTVCDSVFSVGYAPELGSFDAPQGGWDYLIDFVGPADRKYNSIVGETGNLDGRWIRSIDRDLWNGQDPDDPAGPAPGGPAPGGVDIVTRSGQGICGTGDATVLRILDPGNTGAPIGTAFPAAFDPPGNSRILLGLDLGVTDQNVLKTGVTLSTRLRLSSNPPEFMLAIPASGDGSPISAGIGMVGVYYKDNGTLPGEGLTAGAAVSLQSGANGGDLQFSAAGQDVDGIGTLNFVNVWLTVVGGANPDTYDVNVYLNGALNSATEVGGAGLTLDAGVADFGLDVINYLALGSNDTANDCLVEIDFVAYKLGVHVPTSTPCAGDPPNAPTGLVASPLDGKVDLSWTAPATGPSPQSYAILRDGVRVGTVAGSQTAYTDLGLTNGTQYCYRIKSLRGLFESAESNQSCATPTGGAGGKLFHRGDSDNNGNLQLTDAVRILGFLFSGQAAPTCLDAADADDNGVLQLTDAVRILGYLFLGQAAPSPPGPPDTGDCGEDPTPGDAGGDIGCETYTSCG